MEPALPAEPSFGAAGGPDDVGVDVGSFEQGSPVSRWALARYLVGRAVAESVSRSLFLVGFAILALAVVAEVVIHSTLLAVLLGIVAFGVLALRALLRAVLSRIIAADQIRPLETRLQALVSDTRGDVLRELRRIGLPGHTWTLPLLAFRLFGRKRQATFEQLRSFDVNHAVPPARLDELHLLLRSVAWRGDGTA
jgi:hypothetical protein